MLGLFEEGERQEGTEGDKTGQREGGPAGGAVWPDLPLGCAAPLQAATGHIVLVLATLGNLDLHLLCSKCGSKQPLWVAWSLPWGELQPACLPAPALVQIVPPYKNIKIRFSVEKNPLRIVIILLNQVHISWFLFE